ncbi:MAG: hypothetical protein HY986_03270 [Candidatus Melainabacteria bacterium]|nr:hypothetical protein [Candidatus Melainabacteria bacterium]
MNSKTTSLFLAFLLLLGRIKPDGAERLRRCVEMTALPLVRLLATCGTLTENEIENLVLAVQSVQERRPSLSELQSLLLLRQAISMQVSFCDLAESNLFRRLNPLSLYLLHQGCVGLSDFQQALVCDAQLHAQEQVDGRLLWRCGLLSTSAWCGALSELRLLQTGRISLEELERAGVSSLAAVDAERLFDLDTWLLSSESLALPSVLSFIEDAVCANRVSAGSHSQLSLPIPLTVQKVIVSLKVAVRGGQIGLEQALSLAQLTYASLEEASPAGGCAISLPAKSVEPLTDRCATAALDCRTTVDAVDFPLGRIFNLFDSGGVVPASTSQVA